MTSVTVMTALTSAAGSAAPSTTTIALMVDGAHAATGVVPAATRLESPTVTIAIALSPRPLTWATSARSVHAEVSRPTHGPGIARRTVKRGSRPSA